MSTQDESMARRLVEGALFLRMYGERPPGAPRADLHAETWRQWDIDAEAWIRGTTPCGGCGLIHDGSGEIRPVEAGR